MKSIHFLFFALISLPSFAQKSSYWQQHADYKMEVSMDVKTYQYKGKQQLVYTNNSPDTLKKVFYHLYPNAFQPGSEMDMRARTIKDPDRRMAPRVKIDGKDVPESRIKNLKPNEIGFLKIIGLKQDGALVQTIESETVLEVILAKPILPGKKTTFTLDFDGQVPIQIRRSGRNNSEGVEFSMSQWYPKLAEYDFEGWHADPYIGREFYGVWGNFDVKITIDKEYVLGGTGDLQNANKIGHGYQNAGVNVTHAPDTKKLTWHFLAKNVHDFTWAADKEYLHDIVQVPSGPTLHFLYKNNPKIIANWKKLQPLTVDLMQYFNKTVGHYPYNQYSVIQGGDGGMEYAMCTLMLGEGTFEGMSGVVAHELAHSWFQHILGINEAKHPWMDEGFASYIEHLALNELAEKKEKNPFAESYAGYYALVNAGKHQSLATHADRYDDNRTYGTSTYRRGEIFLSQLEYVIGKENVAKTLKRFYTDFKFKHPNPNDIKRTAEKVSGAQLDWYLIDWTQTTNTIDYGIKDVIENGNKTVVSLQRIGLMPMPIDILVEYADGTLETYYIPLRMMHFKKENPYPSVKRTVLNDWAWGNPNYEFTLEKNKGDIKNIIIDPSGLMADVKSTDNSYPAAVK